MPRDAMSRACWVPPQGVSFGDIVTASVLVWANTYNTNIYNLDIHAIHTHTYTYIHIHTLTYTYIYIHIHTPGHQCWEGFVS